MANSRGFAWFGWVFFVLVAFGMSSMPGCSCKPDPAGDAGGEKKPPENTGPFPTKIRFISPVEKELISGQISIEVEILDGDGIDEVAFVINGKPYKTVTAQNSATTTKESPRWAVQVASSFLPRGLMHLTVKTVDKRGDKAEKTIQVQTRERWVAAFGVAHNEQLHVRPDKHLYLRVYRTEQDISRVSNPGPYDQVGAAILTANAKGSASWLYRGLGEVFSPFVMDAKYNIYFGSRKDADGTNRLIALGPGQPDWQPSLTITPEWEQDLKEWTVKSKPLLQNNNLTIHLEKPAQGGDPAVSVIAQFKTADGTENWRYAGNEAFQVLRGPFQFANGQVLFFSRKAGETAGFKVQVLGSDGKQVWEKAYPEWRLNVVNVDPAANKMYIGVEKRSGQDVSEAAVICVDPAGKKECWNTPTGKSWPDKMAFGTNLLFVTRHVEGGAKELAALDIKSGKESWKKSFAQHVIPGVYATVDDACIAFAVLLDEFKEPNKLQIARFDSKGNENWRFENNQYYPLSWLVSSDSEQTLWLIVRNVQDNRELLGHKLLVISNRGKRLYLFSEEARKHQFMQFFPKDVLYVTSTDSRDARVHNLIAR